MYDVNLTESLFPPQTDGLLRDITVGELLRKTADRRSLKNQHGKPLREAMTYEWHNGREALFQEGVRGAGQFANSSEKD